MSSRFGRVGPQSTFVWLSLTKFVKSSSNKHMEASLWNGIVCLRQPVVQTAEFLKKVTQLHDYRNTWDGVYVYMMGASIQWAKTKKNIFKQISVFKEAAEQIVFVVVLMGSICLPTHSWWIPADWKGKWLWCRGVKLLHGCVFVLLKDSLMERLVLVLEMITIMIVKY